VLNKAPSMHSEISYTRLTSGVDASIDGGKIT